MKNTHVLPLLSLIPSSHASSHHGITTTHFLSQTGNHITSHFVTLTTRLIVLLLRLEGHIVLDGVEQRYWTELVMDERENGDLAPGSRRTESVGDLVRSLGPILLHQIYLGLNFTLLQPARQLLTSLVNSPSSPQSSWPVIPHGTITTFTFATSGGRTKP
jgi:hypothetical protein